MKGPLLPRGSLGPAGFEPKLQDLTHHSHIYGPVGQQELIREVEGSEV